jgi:predicted amidohydrolase
MKVAAVQFAPVFARVENNTQTVVETILRLRDDGVDLVVFPEAFLTGYGYDTLEDALDVALESGSSPLSAVAEACNGLFAIVGYAEREGDLLYNTAGVFGHGRQLGRYRKTHLPYLGMDRFVTPGDALPVFDLDGVRIGIGICFDIRFPEVARCYAIAGADIVCVPTNWPEFAEPSSDLVCPTRAIENHVFVIAADRVGEEGGVRFCGHSKIIDPLGNVLANADHTEEAIIAAEFDPTTARSKTIVVEAGVYELPLFEGRSPALYTNLVEK